MELSRPVATTTAGHNGRSNEGGPAMFLSRTLVFKLALTGMILATAAAFGLQQPETPAQMFRVLLGVGDKKPSNWGGMIDVAGGEVVAIAGWRFEGDDKVDGTKGWSCQTRDYLAFDKRIAIQLADGKPRYPQPVQPWPNGVVITVKGKAPKVTLKLPKGSVLFAADQIETGELITAQDGQVKLERIPLTSVLRPAPAKMTDNAVQDDYPAFWVHYQSGKQYLAWVAYQNAKDRILLAERDGPDGVWSAPKEVSKPGYHFRVQLATTHGGKLWIVWSEMVDKNWDLYARPYQDGQFGETVRLTEDTGPDLWHRMTTDSKGRALARLAEGLSQRPVADLRPLR